MLFRCFLSISEVIILLETEHALIQSKEFESFFVEETAEDVHVSFCEVDHLPPIPEHIIFSDECYRIGIDENGNLQKYFFEIPEDPVHYAVATYDQAAGWIRVDYLQAYRHCVSEVRNCFYHLLFESLLLHRSKFCLHASCVDTPLGGLLFSGVSGIGKSTQADLWCKYRKSRQINGDRPILSCDDGNWTAWGSPYAGSSKCYVNDSCDITAIIMLKQARICSLRRMTAAEAFRAIWSGLTVHSWDTSFVESASSLTLELIEAIPVFELCCTPNVQAVNYLEQELRKELSL